MPRATTERPAGRTPTGDELRAVTVLERMNDHGAMTVETADGATREIVEYATAAVRAALEPLPEGTTVRVAMTCLPGRGDAWRAEALGPEQGRGAGAPRGGR